MKPSVLSNCEEDFDEILFTAEDKQGQTQIITCEGYVTESSKSSSSSQSSTFSSASDIPSSSHQDEKHTLKMCSNTYFLGYIGKKNNRQV